MSTRRTRRIQRRRLRRVGLLLAAMAAMGTTVAVGSTAGAREVNFNVPNGDQVQPGRSCGAYEFYRQNVSDGIWSSRCVDHGNF